MLVNTRNWLAFSAAVLTVHASCTPTRSTEYDYVCLFPTPLPHKQGSFAPLPRLVGRGGTNIV